MTAPLVASPMCFPGEDLESVFSRFQRLGFTRFEAFTSGPASALDIAGSADRYLALASRYGLSFHSVHLPVIRQGDPASLEHALKATDFTAALGASIALYKADSIDAYVENATVMLSRAAACGITLVLQNHAGSILATDDDVATVLGGVADARLRVLLEVGHYEKVGIPWRTPFARFRDRIAYCHIKDMRVGRSVVVGSGEVDFVGLFSAMDACEYANGYVLELELRDLANDTEQMMRGIRESIVSLERMFAAGANA